MPQEHGPPLFKIRKETAKLLNMPLQGVRKLVGKGVVRPVKNRGERLKNVFAAPMEFTGLSTYRAPVFPKTEQEKKFLDGALKQNFVFEDLSSRELLPLINAMEKMQIKKGEVIIEQGDVGDYFYVISKGTVSIKVNGKVVGDALGPGASFGELALMYASPRAATVTALETIDLFRVDQKTFRMIYQAQAHSAETEKRQRLEGVDFLANLADADKQNLVEHMSMRLFKKGDVLQEKGAEAKMFWIVDSGEVTMKDLEVGGTKLSDIKVESGEYFGQHALISGTPLFGNAVADTDGRAFTIDKESFVHAVGDADLAAARSLGRKGLASVQVIHDTNLSHRMLDSLVQYIHTVQFKEGTSIMTMGSPTEAGLYFLRGGTVHLKSPTSDITMEKVGMFGDDLLDLDAKTGKNGPRDTTTVKAPYTVKVTSSTATVGVLLLKDCRKVFDTIYMGKGLPTKEDSIRNMPANMDMFQKHTILGAGTFGQVWLVSRKDSEGSERVYALKIQSKYELVKNHQAKGVVHEKMIMAELHHPFVANLVSSFKDDTFVYMLMDLVQGGELESIMHSETGDTLTDDQAKFYTAGIVEGLAYMHRLGYVYRDLKPQNVLISNEGYPVIADFGFAKYVAQKTFTFCGTPLYLAPEIILNRGHNWGADHWSLGVLVYEMLVGYTPFYEDHMDQMELFRAIVQDRPNYPSSMTKEAKSYVSGLLQKNPRRRIGSGKNGLEELFWHPWLSDIDFAKLRHMEYKAPYVPNVANPLDSSNFEDWSSMEDKMDQKYPKLKSSEAAIFDKF
mmetsp:Transcript_24681/g.68259  ORF Transcript_24681/g.68259 Transcript_24681/m.68259 type:complete len:789 (-) Transcript_24681:113-2479(-)|eukprot:CAMPEP_0168742576 /NCGR_PEP_ID=MMETSP0724-20121128/13106_1 /TAXON_ID=265536 /ORGANISM="Amphiprora sp., Strain CCMP467" /LENGTH=788 /DNA_ID=CAMNT_0008790127 /DNA_START=94 /DNA_END=2460 /DNA_ORIENTATION=+